jgi:hypothetical protein
MAFIEGIILRAGIISMVKPKKRCAGDGSFMHCSHLGGIVFVEYGVQVLSW